MAKAKFNFCDPSRETETEVALREAHALGMCHGCAEAAAVICQTIAAMKPEESGYPIFAYGVGYNHYTDKGMEGRQWDAAEATLLEPYKHSLAKLAISNRTMIETIYSRCFSRKKDKMSEHERQDAAVLFRNEMQRTFGNKGA